MSNHGDRFEDIGIGRLIHYWPIILLIFSLGGWYRSSQANEALAEQQNEQLKAHDTRITRVEDAIVSLQKIVEWQDRHRR